MPFLLPLPPPALIAACAMPPQVRVLVTARVDAWDIRPTVSTAELDRLARETGMGGKHRAYGFYVGDVAVAATAEIDNPARDVCLGPVTVHLTMRLTNRHIGVAKDIQNGTCHFANVVAHYQHHADADAAVFQRYAIKVTTTLDGAQASLLFGAGDAADAPASILKATDAAIEPVLADMDAARASVRNAVDTPGEVGKLDGVCGDGI